MKTSRLLIMVLIATVFISCTSEEIDVNNVYSSEIYTIGNVQMNIGDYTQYFIQGNDSVVFEVDINGEKFEADEVRVVKQDSIISIIGRDLLLDRTVFLNFMIKQDDIMYLGKSNDNPFNNVAGYLLNSENIGYVTSEVYNTCGSIIIEGMNNTKNTVSGKFNFSACDRENHFLELTNGIFKNIVFD